MEVVVAVVALVELMAVALAEGTEAPMAGCNAQETL